MPVEIIEYRNKPILKLTQENSFVKLQFGITKAKLIVANYQAILNFIKTADNQTQENNA